MPVPVTLIWVPAGPWVGSTVGLGAGELGPPAELLPGGKDPCGLDSFGGPGCGFASSASAMSFSFTAACWLKSPTMIAIATTATDASLLAGTGNNPARITA